MRHILHFQISLTDCHTLDVISLIIWLLVIPNVEELDVSLMSNDDKYQLVKDLDQIVQLDQHVKLVLKRIKRLTMSLFDNANYD